MKSKQHSDGPPGSPRSISTGSWPARLLRHVSRRIARRGVTLGVEGRGPWITGFSHGPDSTLLLALLRELSQRRPLPPLRAVHVDHGLRPESAAEAEAAVRAAAALGVPCEIVRVTAAGGETAARTARLEALAGAARAAGATAVLLGHHRDDDLETILFRLMRGTGPLGLAGIPELRPLAGEGGEPWLFRPLLDVPGAVIRAGTAALGLPSLEDPTNADPAHTPRNRIRHEILPALRARDPKDLELMALKRAAQALEAAVTAELAEAELPPPDGDALRLPLATLAGLSPWAGDRLLSRALSRLGLTPPPRALLARLRGLAAPSARTGHRVEARGRWRARRARDHVRLERERPGFAREEEEG